MFCLTSSCQRFHFALDAPPQACWGDVAHALSQINRFNGHTSEPYSVAQHSLAVSYYLEQQGMSYAIQLGGLIHDAHEAYFGDISTPVKMYLDITDELLALGIPESVIKSKLLTLKARENRLQDQVSHALGVPVAWLRSDAVKHADLVALAAERDRYLPPEDTVWPIIEHITDEMKAGLPLPTQVLDPNAVRKVFLARAKHLLGRLQLETLEASYLGPQRF